MKFKYLLMAMIAGAFLSSAIDSGDKLKEGNRAPKIQLTDGTAKSLNDGKLTLVNLWNPKQPSSRIDNKEFNSYFSNITDDNIDFISICSDSDEKLAKEILKYDDINDNKVIMLSELSERTIKDYKVQKNTGIFLVGENGKILKTGNEAKEYLKTIISNNK